jgi:hypothetical protein
MLKLAEKSCPVNGVLPFLDPLFSRAPTVVEEPVKEKNPVAVLSGGNFRSARPGWNKKE